MFGLRVGEFEFLGVAQFFDSFFSSHCLCSGMKFFNVNKLLRRVHFGVSGSLSFLVEFYA
jgi:hypothetical protein